MTTVHIPSDSPYGGKSWVARILGRHPTKGYEREFLAGGYATEIGVYEATARKGQRKFSLVARTDAGELVRCGLRDESVAELVAHWLDRLDTISPVKDDDGNWRFRDAAGKIRVRSAAPAAATPADVQDALSRIEASAAFLTESDAGRAVPADDLRAALARIRDIAREALAGTGG